MKIIKIIIFFLLLLSGALYLKGWFEPKEIPLSEQYITKNVEIGDIVQMVSASGTLNPVTLVNVGTQVSGTIKNIYVDFNDKVYEGQVLAKLDQSLLLAQVSQSEANLKNNQAQLELAESNFKRANELFKKEFISRQEFEQYKQVLKSSNAQLDLIKAQLKKDKTNLEYAIIKSPISGVIIDRQVDIGQTVAASLQTPTFFKIAKDLKEMQIDSNFAEADVGKIKIGQTVNFTVDAFPNLSFNGVVNKIRLNPTVTQNVVTYNVVVLVKNSEEVLLPGMTAYLNVILDKKDKVLLVPNSALRFKPKDFKDKNSTSLFVIKDNTLKQIHVKVGLDNGRFSEIISSELKVEDSVIIAQKDKAKNLSFSKGRLF